MNHFIAAMRERFSIAKRRPRVVVSLRDNTGRQRLCQLAMGALIGAAWSACAPSAAAHTMDQYPENSENAETSADIATLSGPSPGCGRQGRHSTGVFNWTTLDGNKKTRTFLVQVPGDYNPSKAYSLNFVFHGAGGNSAQSYSWGLQNATGASENGIFIYPDGINFQNYGIGWDDASNGYDIPFFDNMVNDVETYYCIDKARVFVAGFSWGGDFVTSLVCNRGNSIRAAAANSTTDEFKDRNNYLTYQNLPCPATAHPALRFEHAVGGDSQYPAPYFSNTSKLFQHLNSCSATSTSVTSSTSVMSCVSYNSCTAAFIECSFNANIGHVLPPNWAQDTWAFFSTFK